MGFTPIETQEDFDRAIAERLKRQKETLLKDLPDYEILKKTNAELENTVKTLQEQISNTKDYSAEIEELTGKVKLYEKNSLKVKFALQNGIPFNFADRLSGETEEEIKADAESLSEIFRASKPAAPLKSTERQVSGEDEAYANILKGLEGE